MNATTEPSMVELLAPATHTIHEPARKVASFRFVRRMGSAAWGGAPAKEETPAQKSGRRYENRVRRWLKARIAVRGLVMWDHPWLEYAFEHDSRPRRAQPDFVLVNETEDAGYVFEAKQTWVDTTNQLALYTALLRHMELAVVPATLCRNFTPETPRSRTVLLLDHVVPYSVLMVRV